MTLADLVYGPRTITKVRQVAIPATLLRTCGIHAGDPVYFRLSTEVPGAILIIPRNDSSPNSDSTENAQ